MNLTPKEIIAMGNKTAQTLQPIHPLLAERWSPRAFSSKKISTAQLISLFEAARWAASCFNAQPWFFIVCTQDHPADFEKILSCLVPANQEWAKKAPVLICSAAQLHFEHNGKPNRHALHDLGQAVATMAIQAQALGLALHQMGGFDSEKARELFSIPKTHEPVAMMAIGYAGDPNGLPEKFRQSEQAPRERRPLKNFVFNARWENPWDFSQSGC